MASLNIKITEDIFEESKDCGSLVNGKIQSDCAIQTCIKHIFPDALVDYNFIYVYLENEEEPVVIELPDVANDLVKQFDKSNPNERSLMKELEFSIDIPDELLNEIDLSEVNNVLIGNISSQSA